MALVKAWECEYCRMLSPSDDNGDKDPPEGWLRIYWHKVPPPGQPSQNPEVSQTVCSGRCASKSFLAIDATPSKRRKRKTGGLSVKTLEAGFACPECDAWYQLPQHLGAHRKREHGVPSARDQQARKG